MNGEELAEDTDYPTNLSIISLRTTGNVGANRFGQDRIHTGRQWLGKLGNPQAILDSPMLYCAEGYLAHKWGLAGA